MVANNFPFNGRSIFSGGDQYSQLTRKPTVICDFVKDNLFLTKMDFGSKICCYFSEIKSGFEKSFPFAEKPPRGALNRKDYIHCLYKELSVKRITIPVFQRWTLD